VVQLPMTIAVDTRPKEVNQSNNAARYSATTADSKLNEAVNYAWLLYDSGDMEAAKKRFKSLTILYPDSPDVFYGFAYILYQLDMTHSAEIYLCKAEMLAEIGSVVSQEIDAMMDEVKHFDCIALFGS
jgi:tetratricopeptide (TPR) repeat protein